MNHFMRKSTCVCVCVCVLTELHITVQSDPVVLVVLCPSHLSSQGGINDATKTSDQTRERRHTLSSFAVLT